MTTDVMLRDLRNVAQRRQIAIVLLLALPWLVVFSTLAWRVGGNVWLAAMSSLGVIAIAALTWQRARAINASWLISQLNQQRKDMEDSADLLFSDSSAMNTLERLQRARIEQRLAILPLSQLQPAWPRRVLWLSGVCAVLALIAIVFWPKSLASSVESIRNTNNPATTAPALTRLTEQRLDIRPPAYTNLPARSENALDAKVPEGASMRWSLRFAPTPIQAALVFHDGTRLPLTRTGEDWTASRVIGKATLYRLELRSAASLAAPLADQHLYRLDVEPDQAPQIRVLEPDRSLSLLEAGQHEWPLVFEASDDYGLGAAQLHVTLAQGSGENIQVKQRTLDLRGDGSATRKRYTRTLDLNALGLAAGDDLIVRLSVNDNRAPQAQNTRSASVILRWPPDAGSQTSGMEGLVKKTMPAYFRSQRQIIIDSEALLAERSRLASERYLERSDEIGVDQRILRLRYGQFLGEEADDKPSLGAEPGKHSDHDDDHGEEKTEHAFGDATSVVEAFGHTHDHAEAATLLDPETRILLKSALDQMWQSELHLRQGHPERALPFAYRALDFIKQVQQASRIYLARVGLELPPIDETRRLSGDRKGLRDRADQLTAAAEADPVPGALWQSLETAISPRSSESAKHELPDFDGFERWVRAHESSLPDALGLLAAVDAMRRDPDCIDCAKRLRALLWPLLPKPAAAIAPRAATDRAGQAYLDALQTGRTP